MSLSGILGIQCMRCSSSLSGSDHIKCLVHISVRSTVCIGVTIISAFETKIEVFNNVHSLTTSGHEGLQWHLEVVHRAYIARDTPVAFHCLTIRSLAHIHVEKHTLHYSRKWQYFCF